MNEKDNLRQQQAELESLLHDYDSEALVPTENPLPPSRSIRITDFEQIIKDCDDTALKIVTNTALFYLDTQIIAEDQYLLDKVRMDQMELSNLLFQSKSAKMSYVKLLEEIDNGNVHPRIFEVQSGLQKSMMEITKSKTAYIQIMEQSWKLVRNELKTKLEANTENTESEAGLREDGSTRAMGTLSFLRDIHTEIKEENPNPITIPVIPKNDDE